MKKGVLVVLGADHAGFRTKEAIKRFLIRKKIEFVDLGTNSEQPVDYPDIAEMVAKRVTKDKNALGILVCGSGIGMCIAANKVKGIRAAVAYDAFTARMSRQHNDANVLCLRGRGFSKEKALKLVNIWFNTDFSNEARHKKRINKITKLE